MNRLHRCLLPAIPLLAACAAGHPPRPAATPSTLALAEPEDCAEARALSASDVARLDHVVLHHICQDLPEDPGLLVARLREEGRIFFIPAHVAASLSAAPPRAGHLDDLYLVAPQAADRVRAAEGVRPYLGSGGALSILTFSVNIRGHWEVTQDAMRRLSSERAPGFTSFSENAVALLMDAAQDPDFYEWEQPAAHAQTGNDAEGHVQDGPWRQRFVDWTRDKLRRARDAAQAGRVDEALFFLGYGLHAVQDLASHQGRTNAEHSFNAHLQGQNPDEDKDAIAHAEHLTSLVLRDLPARFGPHWAKLADYHGPRALPQERKQALLGHGKDFGPLRYLAYRRLAKAYQRLGDRPPQQVRWCAPRQCEGLLPGLLP